MSKFIFLLICCLIFSVIGNKAQATPVPASMLKTVAGATNVEIFLNMHYLPNPPLTQHNLLLLIYGNTFIQQGPHYGHIMARRITSLLLNPDTYTAIKTFCVMRPAVIFRLLQGKSHTDVAVCFHCGQLEVCGYDKDGKRTTDIYRIMSSGADHAFLQLTKRVFPKNLAVQAILSLPLHPRKNRISLHLANAPTVSVLANLFDSQNLHCIINSQVRGNTTVDVTGVPFATALKAVLNGANPPLSCTLVRKVYYVNLR